LKRKGDQSQRKWNKMYVAHMGEIRNVYKLWVGKPGWNRPLGRTRHRWENNIKIILEFDGVD
jgi:hypothetical protein